METLAEVLTKRLQDAFPFKRGDDGIHYQGAVRTIEAVTRVKITKTLLYNAVHGKTLPPAPTLYVLSHGLGIPMLRLLEASKQGKQKKVSGEYSS